MASNVLILGGIRSGKSRFAVELAARRGQRVLFVATALAGDGEMRRRIRAHRRARPPQWRTLEAPREVGQSILRDRGDAEVVVVDCMAMLVNNVMQESGQVSGRLRSGVVERAVLAEVEKLIQCMKETPANFILVSNEVGSGIVPANRLARLYSELLGRANQLLASAADEVYLMVAGIPMPLKTSGGGMDKNGGEP